MAGKKWNYKKQPSTAAPLAVLNLPIDRGYGVKTPDVDPSRGDWNVRLTTPYNETFHIWVDEFSTGFEMGGTTAQSRYMRQLFPHNFMQPSIKISGAMPNQYQYNKLAAFIRRSHYDALTVSQISHAQDFLNENGVTEKVTPDFRRGPNGALPTVKLELKSGGTPAIRNQKGTHRSWILEGYIKNIAAGSARFENAPSFTFDFIPAQSTLNASTGIYSDTLVRGSQILDWMTIFKRSNLGRNTIHGTDDQASLVEDAQILGTVFGVIGL